MPDSPDYNKYLPQSNRFSLQDMGELAVRSQAPLMLDRRGDIVWYDDFRNGLACWKATTSGADGSTTLRATQSYHKGFYAQLVPSTGVGGSTFIRTVLGNFVRGRIGFDVVLSISNVPSNVQVQFDVFDGAFVYTAYLKYLTATGAWQILDETSTFQTVTIRAIHSTTNIYWFPLKLVFDLDTQTYIRYLMGDDEFDISAIQFKKAVSVGTPLMQLSINIVGDGTLNPNLKVAQAIITQSEP